MNMKLLSTAVLALSLAAAPAFAQTGTSATGDASGASNQPVVKTDDGKTSSTASNEGMTDADKKFYSENQMFTGFWTDDSMTTMKSDEEIAAAWQAMKAEDQTSATAACGTVNGNRGAYSPATAGMCDRIGGLGK